MKPRWLVLKLLWLAYFSGVGFGGLGRKLTIPPEKEGRRRRAFGSCKKIQRYQVENDLVLNSIAFHICLFKISLQSTEDGRCTSVCSLYGQLNQGQMVNFPAFIASKSFDL